MSFNRLSDNKYYIEIRDIGDSLDTTYAVLGFNLMGYPSPDEISQTAGRLEEEYAGDWGMEDLVDELERMGYDDIDVIITQETAYI